MYDGVSVDLMVSSTLLWAETSLLGGKTEYFDPNRETAGLDDSLRQVEC